MSNPPTHPTTTRPYYDLPLVACDGLPSTGWGPQRSGFPGTQLPGSDSPHNNLLLALTHVFEGDPEFNTVGVGPGSDVSPTDHRLKAIRTLSTKLASSARVTRSKAFAFSMPLQSSPVNGRDLDAQELGLQLRLPRNCDLHHQMQHYTLGVASSPRSPR
jgi:hypothetical protein